MNGFVNERLDDSNFGENKATSVVKSFDAFPKTKPSYTQRTESGGVWTVVLIIASLLLGWSELSRWWKGETTHTFGVEQGIGHDLQINLDVIVAMQCMDLHVNVQDSAGDRILAGSALRKDTTTWRQWAGRSHALPVEKEERIGKKGGEYDEEDVHNYLGKAQRPQKKFKRTPGLPWGQKGGDSCRIYGSMHMNKVQGDFHITARGHGYMEFGAHLDHEVFNFSHTVNELSFGPFYPSLTNPLDNTVATTNDHFYKFQYFLSVVPTIYTSDVKTVRKIDKYHESPSSGEDGLKQYPRRYSRKTVFTNQYAVTEQSHAIPENSVPGVFIKFDIEPIGLTIAEEWSSIPALLIRLVNVVSGLLVAGGWCFQISEWAKEIYGRKGRRQDSFGVLDGAHEKGDL